MTEIVKNKDDSPSGEPARKTRRSGTGQKQKRTAKSNVKLLGCIEEINSYLNANEDWMEDGFLEYARNTLAVISGEYGVTPFQAVVLCRLIEHFDDCRIAEGEIAGFLHISNVRFFRYQKDLDALREKRLIRRKKDDDGFLYSLNPSLVESLRRGEKYAPLAAQNLMPEEFFETADQLYDRREEGWFEYEDFAAEIRTLIKGNREVQFCREVQKLNLTGEELVILLYFCIYIALDRKPDLFLSPLARYCKKYRGFRLIQKAITDGGHWFITRNILEQAEEDNSWLDDEPRFRLTDKAKNMLLSDLALVWKNNSSGNAKDNADGLINCDAVVAKELFYNESEKSQLGRIEEALAEKNYSALQKRFEEKGMPKGITCLFSGPPGTGKTETALQFARKTGRDLMKVDVPEIINFYVGQSEKNIKRFFDKYRAKAEDREKKPILFFNEADALLTTRHEGEAANPSVVQMWNAMQNIILEELENFDGILIATTNLANNLDKAYERRFLFKVIFGRPDISIRTTIWRSKIPELNATAAADMVRRYEFSGGQIDNIARKFHLETILTGKEPDMEKLRVFCREEKTSQEPVRIGF
ncbi:MAG: ATP-binding protein [Treponema sp.]|jgi:hypothetical protein|nr:ATP-binding protein [Treponema sp.]